MKGPLDIHQYLLAHDVPHEIVRLRRGASTPAHLADVLGIPPQRCVAAHAFHALTPTDDVLVVLLAAADVECDEAVSCDIVNEFLTTHLETNAVVAPAGAELVSSRTDYVASHLSPLLLPPDVLVVATPEIDDLAASIVYTATGDAGTALAIPAGDLLTLTRARTAPRRLAKPTAAPEPEPEPEPAAVVSRELSLVELATAAATAPAVSTQLA